MTDSTYFPSSIKVASLALIASLSLSLSNPVIADSFYGPVKPNDTLSKIVKRLYTGSNSSKLTVMKQIVAKNPDSFVKGDMNLLKLHASLNLPGNQWKTEWVALESDDVIEQLNLIIDGDVDRSAPELSVEQMKGRIVFLEAERKSLIEEVGNLKRETQRLEKKVLKLEAASKESDEQLIILDAEIIRLTALLTNNESKISNENLNQLVVLQEKLRLVQEETKTLKTELAATKNTLNNNDVNSQTANKTIALLTQENAKLQKLLEDKQPGVNFYNESSNTASISLFSGNFQIPMGVLVVAGALLSLMLTTLIATRRKKNVTLPQTNESRKTTGIDPFDENVNLNSLLESDHYKSIDKSDSEIEAEENVFKMFGEGSLEVDLKLDMAEAYIQVSDVDSALSILNEVLKDGNELQKRKANRLIKQAA